jgi:hypothetical protein
MVDHRLYNLVGHVFTEKKLICGSLKNAVSDGSVEYYQSTFKNFGKKNRKIRGKRE